MRSVIGRLLLAGLACGGLLEAAELAGKSASTAPWAFQSPVRPALPAVKNASWARNPIDHFILAQLEKQGLKPAPEADRETLVRRLHFDLVGLPPAPEEMERALRDKSDDWYEKVVEHLLRSPRYGERWALYWLDLVRYSESDGFRADEVRPEAWRYRDYVIQSLNADKPYDRFVREQLAGDELYPDDPQAWVATGFLRHTPYEFNAVDLELKRQETLNDITDTVGAVLLGVTLGCAKCHDHKFDPLMQEDYYRIQAFFAGFQPTAAPVGEAKEVERYRQELREWEERTAALRKQLADLEEPHRQKLASRRLGRFPPEYQQMYLKPPAERTPLEQQIAYLAGRQVQVPTEEIGKAMSPSVRQQWQELGKQMSELSRSRPAALPSAMAMTDVGTVAPKTFLLKRGEWRKPEREVRPGYLSVIDDRLAEVPAPKADATTTGRRSVLAQWLTRPDHPLTARVMVNRLWQHHFGRGIVATPSDFGSQGDQATHPELLDWLATEFSRDPQGSGRPAWSLKHMHRLMVTSATYRQSCHWDRAGAKADPTNTLLWRMNRRRLEGEALRDAMLAVSGLLNLKDGGPSVHPELPAELKVSAKTWPVSSDPAERNRRSIFVFAKRNLRYPLFSAFDAPDANESCARRNNSTSAPQALMLLNGKITLDMARSFAGRVLRETAGQTPAQLVERAYRLALGREPGADERDEALTFLARQEKLIARSDRLQPVKDRPAEAGHYQPIGAPAGVEAGHAAAVVDFCHVLLNLNEFIYVD